MMQFRLLLLCFPLWVSCQNNATQTVDSNESKKSTSPLQAPIKPNVSYDQLKKEATAIKAKARKESDFTKQSEAFTQQLYQKLIPYWMGTPWSFDGHPELPGKQPVACSYFVSTTLRDVGVPINRYKMAQMGPMEEAQLLSGGQPVITLTFTAKEDGITQLQSKIPEGIHFIGFGTIHVGFLYRKGDQMAFIHSYYKNNVGVVFDPIENSPLWNVCTTFYVYPLSGNPDFIKLWLK